MKLADWLAGGGGDGDFAVRVAGDGVAAFFEAVVSWAGGEAVGLFGAPASGCGLGGAVDPAADTRFDRDFSKFCEECQSFERITA